MKYGVKARSFISCLLIVFFCCLTFPPTAPAAQTTNHFRVLVLYWYGKDFPANIEFDRGVQAVFRSAGIEYYAEYFEPNRFPGEDQEVALRDFLRRKYSERKIDVLIAMSAVSADFLLKYRDDLFPGVPIVFNTVSRTQLRERTIGTNFPGVVLDNLHAQTLNLALRLHKSTEQVFVINGTIERDKWGELLLKEQFREVESKVKITYLIDLPLSDLLARVKGIPDRSLIFYTRQDYEEPGLSMSMFEVLSLVGAAAKVPIYSPGAFVGYGTIGGYLSNTYECGVQGANLALRMLNDGEVEPSTVIEVASTPVFDWRQLQRWGISEDNLPAGSEFRFRELTFFQRYRWQIIGVVTLCAIQSFLIVALLAERRKRRKARMELRERLKYETLLSERYKLATASGRAIVWDWDLETSNFYFDPMLKSLLGYEHKEIGTDFEGWLRLIHPDDVDAVVARLGHHSTSGDLRFEVEHRLVQKDGAIRWFLASGTVITNDQGTRIRIVGTDTDITERKVAAQEVQDLSTHLIDFQDQERRRIARDLHDGTAQNLLVIALNLQALRKERPEDLEHELAECQKLCEQSLEELRTLSYVLHPPMLDEGGLLAALRWYLAGFSKRSGIDVQLVAPDGRRLPKEVEMDMFRIVQECLSNIHRHSGSPTAEVRIERLAGQVRLSVKDSGLGMLANGQSAPANPASFGVGLSGMRQRLRQLGGWLEIASNNHGTTVMAVIPVPAESSKPGAAHN